MVSSMSFSIICWRIVLSPPPASPLNNGDPFLIDFDRGNGKIFYFTSLLNLNCPYCLTDETSSSGPYDINFGSSLTYNVTFDRDVRDTEYLYIQMSNTGTHITDFVGGYVTIESQ